MINMALVPSKILKVWTGYDNSSKIFLFPISSHSFISFLLLSENSMSDTFFNILEWLCGYNKVLVL